MFKQISLLCLGLIILESQSSWIIKQLLKPNNSLATNDTVEAQAREKAEQERRVQEWAEKSRREDEERRMQEERNKK